MSIDTGDYFFSDQEYEIVEYPVLVEDNRLLNNANNDHVHGLINARADLRLVPNVFILEDMMKVKGGKPFANKPGQNYVVLCTTDDGKMEVRALYTFERELSISSAPDEIVKTADGSKKRVTLFTLIKTLIEDPIDDKSEDLEEQHQINIIYTFYKLNGYKVKKVAKVAH